MTRIGKYHDFSSENCLYSCNISYRRANVMCMLDVARDFSISYIVKTDKIVVT